MQADFTCRWRQNYGLSVYTVRHMSGLRRVQLLLECAGKKSHILVDSMKSTIGR